jgi:hypothetical protein
MRHTLLSQNASVTTAGRERSSCCQAAAVVSFDRVIRRVRKTLNRMKARSPTTALATWISQKVGVSRLE